MPVTSPEITIPVVGRSRLPESSREARTRSTIESAVKAVENLVYLAGNPAKDQKRDQLAARFEGKLGIWKNDEAAVSAINRFVQTYSTYVETFKQSYASELRTSEYLSIFLDEIRHDVDEGGDAWKSAGWALGDSDRWEELFGANSTYAQGMMLGALVDGYLKATERLSSAEGEDAVNEAHKARGRYITAVSRLYKVMALKGQKLGEGKIAGALQTIAEGLGVWEAPEH